MTVEEIRDFLATTAIFENTDRAELLEIAGAVSVERRRAGERLIRQGLKSPAVFFVRSGRLVVIVNMASGDRNTVAHIQAPEVVGELSYVTGKPAVADVDVEIDAELVILGPEAMAKLPKNRETILRGLLRVTAERLQRTVSGGAKTLERPVVLLRAGSGFEAPRAFPAALAQALVSETGRRTLLMTIGAEGDGSLRMTGDNLATGAMPVPQVDDRFRPRITQQLTEWKRTFDNIVLAAAGPNAKAVGEAVSEFANYHGWMLGPGEALPPEPSATSADTGPWGFAVQSAAGPALPRLDGGHQLIGDCAAAERAHGANQALPERFARTAGSIARWVSGLQVGVALGGGAAWGWAHIGVLSVLEKAGVPVDLLSGCSMGSVVGAFRAAGKTVGEMTEIAEYWRTRTRQFIEWRLWKMSLVSERKALKVFAGYLGDTAVNQTVTPYWANAVDIRTGKEYSIRDGSLVDCIRASIALPGLLPPIPRGNHLLVDAGIMDPVPVPLARTMGADFVVAVNAMAPIDASPVATGYPFNAIDVMTRCMFVMGHEIGQARAEQMANVVMAPSMSGISMLQFGRAPEIIERGRIAAEAHIEEIKSGYERLRKQLHAPATAEASQF